jgi:hypothetical protein
MFRRTKHLNIEGTSIDLLVLTTGLFILQMINTYLFHKMDTRIDKLEKEMGKA